MNKKILRILAAALVLVLLVSMVPPVKVQAASGGKVQRVVDQIKDVYRSSQQGAGRYSFFGYCGTMIAWQLYILGITDRVMLADGKHLYDKFAYQQYTSTGFPIRAYSGSFFNLKTALNTITDNGTKDAYNILVGWERTPSEAGSLYGHAMIIFAVLDGVVYFNESYSAVYGGIYYPEGHPIAMTIDDFYSIYGHNTLDGMIHFGQKSYSEDCTYHPAYLYAAVTEGTQLRSEPCDGETDERSQLIRDLIPGEQLSITGLYENPLGEFWYQVEENGKVGYLRADKTRLLQTRYDDVWAESIDVPQEVRQGRNYAIEGQLLASYNRITTVRAQVFSLADGQKTHVMSSTQSLEARRLSLYRSEVANGIDLRSLPIGTYRVELAAVVGNCYYADGALQTEWKTVKLWCSDFRIVSQYGGSYHVRYDAAGGTSALNAQNVAIGDRIGTLPQASRPGWIFAGWYTADGTRVTERTVIAEDVTLVAHWQADPEATGWYVVDGRWTYLENGEIKTGFIRGQDITCYITDTGDLATGWLQLEGKTYYFLPSGAMYLGWMEMELGAFYFTANGAATGWMVIEDEHYYFNESGMMAVGSLEIDGVVYTFDANGVLQN